MSLLALPVARGDELATRATPKPLSADEPGVLKRGRSRGLLEPEAGEHPLAPAMRWAHEGLDRIRKIEDYTCTLWKRERVQGELLDQECLKVKVRHHPFSVYLRHEGPRELRGQEAIYVSGLNDNKVIAHASGLKSAVTGTLNLRPDGYVALKQNRYPITDVGLIRLLERLIVVAQADSRFGECEVNVTPGAKIGRRGCTCVEVVHPRPRREFLFHIARVFVDDELNLPVRYEAYAWPDRPGATPPLLEEYTYCDLRVNVGLSDADFDPENPKYRF